uniref:Uncharacterized protein n=1 Tax=Cucumis melo TaxID=3656 RepID=A0A9I9EHJ3_CUCME
MGIIPISSTYKLNPSRANKRAGSLVQDLDSVLKGTTYLLTLKRVGTYTAEEAGDEGRFNTNEQRPVESDLKRERWKAILSRERS